jgi:hypothetical protein
MRRALFGILALACVALAATAIPRADTRKGGGISLLRVPNGGIQPDAVVDRRGVLHLIYFSGEAGSGNLFYVRSRDYGVTWSEPVRVNSQPGSAIATGTIRGGQIAVARGRVHVVWNGSDAAAPKGLVNPANGQAGMPFLYTQSNDAGTAFEPQRSLTTHTYGIDGGGSVAATESGEVYAAWHGLAVGAKNGEENRQVWVARSQDGGRTFTNEQPASRDATGVCSCCDLQLFAPTPGALYLLYRSATNVVHRDVYLLQSTDGARSFGGSKVQGWDIAACPMSSMSFVAARERILGAWETAGQVYFGVIRGARIDMPVAAPGGPGTRKHPRLASNSDGSVLFVWTEGTAWAKGGSLAWQLFDPAGKPIEAPGRRTGVPVWSFAVPVARPDGSFLILY